MFKINQCLCFFSQLESPFLNNGHASGKLTVNGASHNYRAMFSLNNDHFLSGSFVALPNGFEAAFGLQSSALPSEFQVTFQPNFKTQYES